MGMWTSAGVGYGYQIDHDERYRLPWHASGDDDEELYDGDYEEWWLAVNGWDDAKERPLVTHYVGMSDDEASRDWRREKVIRPEWDAYFDKKRDYKSKLPPFPFAIEWSGHCDYAATMLLDPESTEKRIGDLSDLTTLSFVGVPPKRIADLAKKYGVIVGEQKPKWHVFGYYG